MVGEAGVLPVVQDILVYIRYLGWMNRTFLVCGGLCYVCGVYDRHLCTLCVGKDNSCGQSSYMHTMNAGRYPGGCIAQGRCCNGAVDVTFCIRWVMLVSIGTRSRLLRIFSTSYQGGRKKSKKVNKIMSWVVLIWFELISTFLEMSWFDNLPNHNSNHDFWCQIMTYIYVEIREINIFPKHIKTDIKIIEGYINRHSI